METNKKRQILTRFSSEVSEGKKRFMELMSEEDEGHIYDAIRYIIEHYINNEQMKEIFAELYEGKSFDASLDITILEGDYFELLELAKSKQGKDNALIQHIISLYEDKF